MLEVYNLSKKYTGDRYAVEGLSFRVEPGHIYGFLGANGAGKTTTLNMISGALAPTSGSIEICGHDMISDPIAARSHIGYLPENPPLYGELTVREYLCFVGSAKGIGSPELRSAVRKAELATDIADVENQVISTLSKGYSQRVGIAQAIIANPEIIILDEPTSGLDPKQVVEIRALISKLCKNSTVVFSSHILSEVSELCDNLIIISNGHLIANGTIDAVKNSFSIGKTLTVTAKGISEQKMRQLTAGLPGVTRCSVKISGNESTAELLLSGERDIRESIFRIFADARCPLIEMHMKEPTLEEIFIGLTRSDTGSTQKKQKEKAAPPPQKKAVSNNKTDTARSNRENIAEETDDDGDDYRPLFSGRR